MARKMGIVAPIATFVCGLLLGGSSFDSPHFFSLVSAAAAATSSSPSQKDPAWFPKQACRDAWGNRDLAKFDPARDSNFTASGNQGYQKYLKRLKAKGVDRQSCFKDWTVLVYMAGDNDLSPYAIWDLEEMEGRFESGRYAGSTLKSDLVVQADTAGATGLRRFHIFQREDKPYVAASGVNDFKGRGPETIQSPLVDLLTEAAPSRQGLQEFLEWGVRQYPARKYMVVVWGHGQGWRSSPSELTAAELSKLKTAPASDQVTSALRSLVELPQPSVSGFGGIAVDPATGNGLSIEDLKVALTNTVNTTLEGRPLDVYASDACLMQMTEVATEISETTRYIVGSAQVQSFVGLPYRRLMYEINTGRFLSAGGLVGKTDEGLLVAKMIPLLTEQSLDPVRGQQGRAEPKARETFTMSAIAAESLRQRLVPSLKNLSTNLLFYLDEDPIRGFAIGSVLKATPSFMGGGKELGSFLQLIELSRLEDSTRRGDVSPASRSLATALQDTKDAIDETLIERRYGTRYLELEKSFHLLGYRGLGIWIPNGDREFKKRSSDFAQSKLHQETAWQDWLRSALGI